MTRVAIIGAGIAGLTLARQLHHHADVTLFDKARGPGGRLTTRRASPYVFDHGAPCFITRSTAFATWLAPWIEQGVLQRWDARFRAWDGGWTSERSWRADHPHHVGAPNMNALCKALARELHLHPTTRVAPLLGSRPPWALSSDAGEPLGTFDWVVSTAPAPQSAALMPACFAHLSAINGVSMLGCYALMLGFSKRVDTPFDAALIRNTDVGWISANHSKPGRPPTTSFTVLATNHWATDHLAAPQGDVLNHLCMAAAPILGLDPTTADHIDVHRWHYANTPRQSGPTCFVDPVHQLAACGDWCIQGRVEAAFQSATALAQHLCKHLNPSALSRGTSHA